jgi:hypothetical protein
VFALKVEKVRYGNLIQSGTKQRLRRHLPNCFLSVVIATSQKSLLQSYGYLSNIVPYHKMTKGAGGSYSRH